MHLRILPDHQKLFFQKRYFLLIGVVKNVFWWICAYSQTTRKCFVKKEIFYCLEWLKTCFDAFAHTSRPPKFIFLKRCFWTSVVVKNVFDAFAHTSRPPETFFQKRYFWTSRVVKNVFWCIFAYFQTTRNFVSKKIFFTVWSD
jgi:hypothetical protein